MSASKRRGSEGFHHEDKTGKRSDHGLHEPILAGVHPNQEKLHRLQSAQSFVDNGGDLAHVERAYGVKPEELLLTQGKPRR